MLALDGHYFVTQSSSKTDPEKASPKARAPARDKPIRWLLTRLARGSLALTLGPAVCHQRRRLGHRKWRRSSSPDVWLAFEGD